MNLLELFQNWLLLGFAVALCGFVFSRHAERILPCFATYAAVLLTCTVSLGLAYAFFGFRSAASYYAYWITTLLTLMARSLVIMELCRYGLRAYRGVWALTWRVLSGLALFFLAHATFDAWGEVNRLAIYGLTLERDLDIASIVILTVLLLIRSYYGLNLNSLQRAIAIGLAFSCTVDVINNSIVRDLYTGSLFSWFSTAQMSLWPALKPQIEHVNDLYGTIRLCSIMISIGIWCVALRNPLPAPAEVPELLPAEIYREFSPAVNLRMRAFNDRLVEMLKP